MPTPIEVDGEQMMQCNACGNVWDGFAQCNCWQWMDDDDADGANDSQDSGYGGA